MSVDRPAAKGDYANIDLNAEIDGETVDSQEGVSYELGSATMLDGLDEALEGLSAVRKPASKALSRPASTKARRP